MSMNNGRPRARLHQYLRYFILMSFIMLTFAMMSERAAARCGSDSQIAYDDVAAVMIEQNGCGGTIHDPSLVTPIPEVSTFRCSTFWVLFRGKSGPATFPTVYSQFNLKGEVGTFNLSTTLSEVKGILRSDRFYDLAPPDYMITDAARTIVSVKRCAVVTRIKLYNSLPDYLDPNTLKLVTDIEHLILTAKRSQTSKSASIFELTGLFYM